MRCFSKEEYRNEFNTGEKAYLNSMQYFHDLEDEFQRDFEGGIFRQAPNTTAYLLRAKANLSVNDAIDKVINKQLEDGEWIIKTIDTKFYINGYLFCMTIIPKSYLQIREKEIVFNEKHNIADGFYYLLNQYTKNSKYTFISLYDAEIFMERFYSQMTERGYAISYGCVDYENLSQEERYKFYSEHNITKLVFTKDEKFSYQNEFRIFLNKPGAEILNHIEESGIDMQPSVLNDMVYLSPEYMNELGWNKNEI